MTAQYPKDLKLLIQFLKKIPGIGSKSAERYAFSLLKWSSSSLQDFSSLLSHLKERVTQCPTCGCLKSEQDCLFCNPSVRDPRTICVISSPKDVFSIEETRAYKGLYHVIDHLLSPLDGRHTDSLHIEKLENRIKNHPVEEIILALDSTLEGDATALFIKKYCKNWGVKATRLAFGLPVGSSLEYVDEGTLSRAMTGRQTIQ